MVHASHHSSAPVTPKPSFFEPMAKDLLEEMLEEDSELLYGSCESLMTQGLTTG